MLRVICCNRSPIKASRIYTPDSAAQIRKLECKWYSACLEVADNNKWPGFTCKQCNGYARLSQEELERDNEGILKVFAAWAQMEREASAEDKIRESASESVEVVLDDEEDSKYVAYSDELEDQSQGEVLLATEESQEEDAAEEADLTFSEEPTGPKWYEKPNLNIGQRPRRSPLPDIDFTKPIRHIPSVVATVAMAVTVTVMPIPACVQMSMQDVQAQVQVSMSSDIISIDAVDRILQERRSRKSKSGGCVVVDGDCIKLV